MCRVSVCGMLDVRCMHALFIMYVCELCGRLCCACDLCVLVCVCSVHGNTWH